MNKKFLSAVLFGALLATTTSTFVSCKDYDDDIENLQAQLDKKASLEELSAKVTTLESSISAAQGQADKAIEDARKAKEEAEKAYNEAQGKATAAELAALKTAYEAADTKLNEELAKKASLTEVETKVAALKAELEGELAALASSSATKEEVNAAVAELNKDIDAVSAEIMSLIGGRLTSLSVIPTDHINGIAAITLRTLQYTPQKYAAIVNHDKAVNDHENNPVLDHVNASNKVYSLATDRNEAYFHVSPNLGVQKNDIELPLFDCIQSSNTVTRGATVSENSPIKPVDWSIDKNVLTVYYKKTIAESIAVTEDPNNEDKEHFWMASLKAPIAAKNLTAEEAKAYEEDGTQVYVNSEYVRLHEEIRVPYLVNSRTDFKKEFNGEFAEEVQTDSNGDFYVHYHDSICAYQSLAGQYIDVKAQYDQVLDLKKLVKVCATNKDAEDHADHMDLTNYKDYGLTFRFTLAKAPYITLGGEDNNTNKTDQQQFAKIDNATNGHMTSKVYTINGNSATAVGREPIVRVELVDTVNNALVAQRYLKVKWVKEVGVKKLSYAFNDTIYACGAYAGRLGTQPMNEVIYDKVKEGGMTKQEFHAVYVNDGFDGAERTTDDGTAKIVINNENGVESYNIVWDLTHADIVAKYPVWKNQETMTFKKVIYWTDPSESYPTLEITLTRTIYKPQFGLYGFDGRYWKNNDKYNIFNINPVVYNTVEYNPGWNENADCKSNATCNIYADLLNGFLNKEGQRSWIGADWAVYYTDKLNACGAAEKIEYSGEETDKHIHVGYAPLGVRFVFDAEKIADYKYPYFNGTEIVEKTATISADGTKLYIDEELAASIENYADILCTNKDNNPAFDATDAPKTYFIKLEEETPNHAPRSGETPTEAAKALVGKYVPLKMVADLCDDAKQETAEGGHSLAHLEVLKSFEAFIIEPLTVTEGDTQDFTDATTSGSTIDVTGAFTYTSWNADENGKYYPVSKYGDAHAKALWEFYEAVEATWRTDLIKTNLKQDANGNLVPTAGVKDGKLPTTTTVVYSVDEDGKETLTYNNYSGTPVNQEYIMYIPVEFGYKWKTFTKTFEVKVKVNAGTPNV